MGEKMLWEVPFEFRIRCMRLVLAESAEAAKELAKDGIGFEESNLDESNVFFDSEEDVKLLSACCVDGRGEKTDEAIWGEPVPSKEDPEEHGFEVEDDEDDEGSEDDDMKQKD